MKTGKKEEKKKEKDKRKKKKDKINKEKKRKFHTMKEGIENAEKNNDCSFFRPFMFNNKKNFHSFYIVSD